ncbi:MAG TPA: hypothetical protein VMH81_03630 [Bryobacteraceae bacterium]|nr:hypothetical protein [Bryobacteraceae bacterium]
MKAIIKSDEAIPPYDTHDSILEKPSGLNPGQNAWLTLQLRVKLDFVDSNNLGNGGAIVRNGKLFAIDADGYLFEAQDWTSEEIAQFQRAYVRCAEDTWNYQFLLKTPEDYSELDYQSGGDTFRPNILCLFRLSVLDSKDAPLDRSPAAGPMRFGPPHQTITVVNLNKTSREPQFDSSVPHRTFGAGQKKFWRSSGRRLCDTDVITRRVVDADNRVYLNTIGHEVGHLLGQCHIMGLKGDPRYQKHGRLSEDIKAYGKGSSDRFDFWNIMGAGNRLYLINAVSWKERIPLHTGVSADQWQVTGLMNTPPRRLPRAPAGLRR